MGSILHHVEENAFNGLVRLGCNGRGDGTFVSIVAVWIIIFFVAKLLVGSLSTLHFSDVLTLHNLLDFPYKTLLLFDHTFMHRFHRSMFPYPLSEIVGDYRHVTFHHTTG